MPSHQKISRDPAIINPPLQQWQSDAVKLSDDLGELSFHCAESNGVLAAAVVSQIDVVEHFSPSPDSIYLAMLEHLPPGSMLDGLNLPTQGLAVVQGGSQHLARTLPGSRWTELTLPLEMLEHIQLDPEPLLRYLRRSGAGLIPQLSPAASALSGHLHTLLANPQAAALDSPNAVTALVLAASDVLNEWAGRPPVKPDAGRNGYYRALGRALEYIEASYAEQISLAGIAAHAACSPRHLQQAFQTLLSTTPLRYLKARRLARTRQLLLRPRGNALSVGEAAHAAGFLHRGRFSAAYQQHYGELPAASIGARH